MIIAHTAPPPSAHSATLHPATLATAAERQPQKVLPETDRPAQYNAPPEVSAVAVLGYN